MAENKQFELAAKLAVKRMKACPDRVMPHHRITTGQHGFPFFRCELEDIRQRVVSLMKWTLHAISEQLEQRDAEVGDGRDWHGDELQTMRLLSNHAPLPFDHLERLRSWHPAPMS